ncbi:MAG: PDZ domain-containing protein [Verrucomicrobiae bacterium]|nr:PDZ domain-containing protein [Verrucomicrobiae bacterium]
MKPSYVTRLLGLCAAVALGIPAFSHAEKPKPPRPDHPSAESKTSPATEVRPWLGVATSPIAPVLREHLELPEGFGVQIEYVVEGSPADKAGLTERDILTRYDDQLLTTPEHLAVLVRSMKKGDKVTLTLIRKGAEQTVDVTLGENEVPVQPEWPQPGYGFQFPNGPENSRQWQDSVKRYQDRLRDWVERAEPQRFHPQPQPEPPVRPEPEMARPGKPALPLPEDQPERNAKPPRESAETIPGDGAGKPPALSVRPGFPIEVFSGAGLIRIDNEEGEVSIKVENGEHSIKIVNADGETVYEGDYDPEKGPEALPEEARKQLKKMKLDDLKLLGVPQGGNGTTTETKTEIKIQIGTDPDSEQTDSHQKDGLL